MNITQQKKLALKLHNWDDGQNSPIYAIASCMLSDSNKGVVYSPLNHRGHILALRQAQKELRTLKETANFPECVSARDVKTCNSLADQLEEFACE